MTELKYKVSVKCMTYNHANYIREALQGFAMQETTFPVVYLVVDDASTDGEPKVLKKWAGENLEKEEGTTLWKEMPYGQLAEAPLKGDPLSTFVILLLKENHYQKRIGYKKLEYIAEWNENSEYQALCEGDDYWIDTQKLQEQVNFMDKNPKISFSFHQCKTTSGKQYYPYPSKQILTAKDVILRHYVPTASVLCKSTLLQGVTNFNLSIGDIPLEIQLAMQGPVYYIDKEMSVYRDDNPTSITHSAQHFKRSKYTYAKMYWVLFKKYPFNRYSIYLIVRCLYSLYLVMRNSLRWYT